MSAKRAQAACFYCTTLIFAGKDAAPPITICTGTATNVADGGRVAGIDLRDARHQTGRGAGVSARRATREERNRYEQTRAQDAG